MGVEPRRREDRKEYRMTFAPLAAWRLSNTYHFHKIEGWVNTNGVEVLRAAQEVFRDSLVSVVMPTYNQSEFLPEALASVLNQTHRNLQVIIVDDGSTDETPAILKTIIDPRVEVIRHRKNRGLPAALNAGFAGVRGRFVMWVASDDRLRPHCVETLYRALQNNPSAGLAHGNVCWFGTQEGILDTSDATFEGMYYLGWKGIGPAFMMRTALLEHLPHPPFDEELMGIEDTAFALEVRRRFKVVHVPETLYDYRFQPQQLTHGIQASEGYRPLIHRMQDRFDRRHWPEWQREAIHKAAAGLKVLYVFPWCGHGGVENVLLSRIRLLQGCGVCSEVCFGRDVGGLGLFRGLCPCHLIGDVDSDLAFGKLSKLVRDRKFDVVTVISYPGAFRALADAGYRGAVVVEIHGHLPMASAPETSLTDACTVVSTDLVKGARAAGLQVPTLTIPNGIDVDRFAGPSGASQETLAQAGVPKGVRLIAWAGRLASEKNWRLLLDLFELLKNRRRDVMLWLAGGGEQEAAAEALRLEIDARGLGRWCRWFPVVEPEDMPKFYGAVAASRGVFVLPSECEGFGLVAVEAMASGVPVVTSRVGGLAEVVVHGESGFLVPLGEKGSYVRTVSRLLDRDDLYRRISEGARRRAQKFDIEKNAAAYHGLYSRLIEAKAEPVVVLVSGVDWNDLGGGQRPRKLAEAFVKLGHRVVFLSLSGSTHGAFNGVKVHSLPVLAGMDSPRSANVNGDSRWWIRRLVELILRSCKPVLAINCDYVVLSHVVVETLKSLGAKIVYDCMDDWEAFAETYRGAGWDIGYRPKLEAEMIRRAHLVTASARRLQQRCGAIDGGRRPVLYLPNAVDAEFTGLPLGKRPAAINGGQKVVGFVGTIDAPWMNLPLITRLAKERPEWQFFLVGPATPSVRRGFADNPNIRFTGVQPHGRLHHYIDHFDVGIIPFRVNRLTRSVSPVKVFDYLARGKPVVASRLPELRGYPGVTCVSEPGEWLQALMSASSESLSKEQLQKFLSENTWEQRAESIWTQAMQ